MAEGQTSYKPSKEEVDKHKVNAILAYLGILIIVPLVNEEAKKSKYVMHHVNQGLVLFIASFVSVIPILGWFLLIPVLVLWIMGIVSAAGGEMKKLPLVGGIELIK